MEDKKHSFMDQLNLFFIGAVKRKKSKGVRRVL